MTLHVLDPGLYTLVVDFGRPGYRSLGVPIGGAADQTSLTLGNALVGNPPDAAALEISLSGPTLRAECELACVVYGAPLELFSDRQPLRVGKTFTLQPGEELRIAGTWEGMRAYLCVRGGFQTPIILGSRSSLEPLRAGMDLPCLPGVIHARFAPIRFEWNRSLVEHSDFPPCKTLRVLDGPQVDWFPSRPLFAPDEEGWEPPPPRFMVSPASNRMGLRLQGDPLPVPDRELLSEPVCPGAVQVTRDGQCIILGVDGQTIGGYPKIAQIISADLDALGQLRPEEGIVFRHVTLQEAEEAYRQKQAELAHWVLRLQTALAGF
jgi:antagonist of KipI